jgi:hypothetical protein
VADKPFRSFGRSIDRYPWMVSSFDIKLRWKAMAGSSHFEWKALACACWFPSNAMFILRSLYSVVWSISGITT